jgi:hypothetical protein
MDDSFIQPQDNKPRSKAKKIAILAGHGCPFGEK